MAKRYYWLKLKDDFFRQKEIKKLRRIAGGDTFTIIYLKIQLLSLKDNGKLFFEGIEDNFADELALEIDEDVDNVQVTINYLIRHGLLTEVKNDEYLFPQTVASIGSETAGAERQRKYEAKKKALADAQKKALKGEVSENDTPMINADTEQEQRKEQRKEQEKEQHLDKEYFEILKDDYEVKEIEALNKYFIENNIAADVVKEKLLIVKSRKSIKNRVGSLISAIRDNWEMPKELKEPLNPKVFNNFDERDRSENNTKGNMTYAEIERKLLGWDKDDDEC